MTAQERAANRSLHLLRSRLPLPAPANDNGADWRSIWARRFVRPAGRLIAFFRLAAALRWVARGLRFPR
jgi:hypothetical protein